MLDAQQVQERGVQIVDVNGILDRGITQLIGIAIRDAGFDPAAGQDDERTTWGRATAKGGRVRAAMQGGANQPKARTPALRPTRWDRKAQR